MRIELVVAAAAPMMLMATPAAAQDGPMAARQILTGAFPQAEKTLVSEMQVNPGRPEVKLNLAAVYYATGRRDEARALYQQVLAQPDEQMQVSTNHWRGSHEVAQTGLRYLDSAQRTASR